MKRSLFKSILIVLISIILFSIAYQSLLKAFYPVKFKDIVLKYSENYNVEPALVFAIIKNESGFDEKAVSSIGARGLMQITEETFLWIKSKIEPESGLTFDDMFDPEANIRFGTYLLKLANSEFQSESAVYSAYHAGFNITRKWLNDEKYSSDGIELHTVPYEDTAQYIKNVKKTLKIYKKLYGGKL